MAEIVFDISQTSPNREEKESNRDNTQNSVGLNHNGPDGVFYMMPTALNGWQLPNEPHISISGNKKVVSTSLAGNKRRGSVKEIINTNDYKIVIKGVIINPVSDVYPFDEVEQLQELFELNEAIEITNALTDKIGIKNVVLTDLSIPAMVGKPNRQNYQISCISDEDFILVKE